MDRRRSRWIAWDAEFFYKNVGTKLVARYGAVGVTLWVAFLSACKRNPVAGQVTYVTGDDRDFFRAVGLPDDFRLVDNVGKAFTLERFWRFLGEQKQTVRRRRGRLTDVRATQWEHWQKDARTQFKGQSNGRSDPIFAGEFGAEYEQNAAVEKEKETDKETSNPPYPPKGDDESCPNGCEDGRVYASGNVVSWCSHCEPDRWAVG